MSRYFTASSQLDENRAIQLINDKVYKLNNTADLKPLFDRIGDARIVMLGEASHGTHEYYTWRSAITRELIKEKGFNFIAVEGDWPDCYRMNRYIKDYKDAGASAFDVLNNFRRWPTWMWANWEIVALTEWLHKTNLELPKEKKVGFYGLDVYSLWESLESITAYLSKVDPKALEVAEEALRCFEPFRKGEGQEYARATMKVPELCKTEVIDLLIEIRRRMPQYNTDHEHVFSTEQNALIAVNAEKYYRAMIHGGPHSWNIRDRHMADTLEKLLDFHGNSSKAIIWAHNTHVGDARATDMVDEGMYNIGELARLQHNEKGVVLVGFGSYGGSVIAGRRWGAAMNKMQLPNAEKGSWEYLLHSAGAEDKLCIMDDLTGDIFMENHVAHRAVGVVYNPEYEKYGNYVPSIMPLRYDAFIFLDHTQGLYPLHILPLGNEVPDTYPFGV
jgi:erythromycin esterase-like protein